MKKVKFNIIDFLIIVAVVVVAVAGVYVLGSKSETAIDKQKTKVVVAMEQKNVDEITKAYYEQNNEVGNIVSIGIREKISGVVKEIEISNAQKECLDQKTGETKLVDVEGKYDLRFIFEIEVDETDRDFLIGTDKIKIGKALNFNGKGYSGYGNVISIKKIGGEE